MIFVRVDRDHLWQDKIHIRCVHSIFKVIHKLFEHRLEDLDHIVAYKADKTVHISDLQPFAGIFIWSSIDLFIIIFQKFERRDVEYFSVAVSLRIIALVVFVLEAFAGTYYYNTVVAFGTPCALKKKEDFIAEIGFYFLINSDRSELIEHKL